MAYQEHGMWEVLEVLKRLHRGESRRHVARVTGRSRKTIRRYLETAAKLGWAPAQREPDERLAAEVITILRPGPKDVVAESAAVLEPFKEQIRQWLAPDDQFPRGLRLTKVHTLLQRRHVQVSYSALYRYVCTHLDFGRHASTVRVADVDPGELAEVDFGRLGLIPDPATGGRRVLHALIVTLVYSRHQYVHVTHRQRLGDLIDGLEAAWEYFGGVVARVVLDNLKAAVLKADRYEPAFQRTFAEYAEHRGFVIDAANVRHATGKPHVERQVPYVRESFFRGEQWLDRDHVQRAVVAWCSGPAGHRIHGTTRKQPLVEFAREEQPALLPLTAGRFDPPSWAEPKVHPDHHVRFERALYSVPYQHDGTPTKGTQVTVRGDRALVRIYLRGTLLKVHPRHPPGGRSTDFADYPPAKTPYAMRDATYLIGKAKEHGTAIGRFTAHLLAGVYPWAKLRQAQQLLRLVDKYGPERVNGACQRALNFDLINTKRVERIVRQALEETADHRRAAPTDTPIIQLPLRFLRAADSFTHHPDPTEDDRGDSTLA